MVEVESNQVLNKAEGQLVAIGKAIEHTKKESVKKEGKASNKELAKRFAKALQEIDEGAHVEGAEAATHLKGKEPLWKKLVKIFTSKKGKEARESQNKETEKGSVLFARGDTVASLSAELEVAVARLRSVSKIDSDQNDLAIMGDVEAIMRISAKMGNMPAMRARPSLPLQKAGMAIADISVTLKHSQPSVMVSAENSKSLHVASESMGESTKLHLNRATADIRASFGDEVSTSDIGGSPKTPITENAKRLNEERNKAFSEYQPKKP